MHLWHNTFEFVLSTLHIYYILFFFTSVVRIRKFHAVFDSNWHGTTQRQREKKGLKCVCVCHAIIVINIIAGVPFTIRYERVHVKCIVGAAIGSGDRRHGCVTGRHLTQSTRTHTQTTWYVSSSAAAALSHRQLNEYFMIVFCYFFFYKISIFLFLSLPTQFV